MTMSSGHSKVLEIFEYLVIVAVAVALAFFIRTFVAEVYEVPTGSMLNTIQLGGSFGRREAYLSIWRYSTSR